MLSFYHMDLVMAAYISESNQKVLLSDCTQASGLKNVIKYFSVLPCSIWLQSLSHCELITDDGIRHLGNGACAHDQLEVIELDNCPLITDASLEHLKSCHSLERIELYDCQQITRAGIKRLRVKMIVSPSGSSVLSTLSFFPSFPFLHVLISDLDSCGIYIYLDIQQREKKKRWRANLRVDSFEVLFQMEI